MRALIRPRVVATLFVGGAALTLYCLTLAPTITWANFGTDGGDLIIAAATLGVPHPPGYPLYITLGHLFAQVPIGNIAVRLNLFSALCMAFAAAVITWNATLIADQISMGEGPGMGVLAGLAFAVAPMVWGQATITEVHALNALLVALILAVLNPIVFQARSISPRRLGLACLIWGLSLTHQLTALALAPLFFIAVRRSLITRHSALVTHYVFLFLLPLTLYFVLLPRAAAQPPINWLGASTLENFGALITAEIYRGYAFAVPLSAYPSRLLAFAQLIVAQFGWLGLGLIVLGIYRAQRHVIAPLIAVICYVIFALGYNTIDSDLYLIPVWLFCAYALAAGAQAFTHYALRFAHHASLITQRSFRIATYALLILIIPGGSLINNFTTHDLHVDRTAEQFAQNVLTAAPTDAIIITQRDAHTFTLWYYRQVEGQRSDVAVIDARLAAYPWYDPMLRAQHPALITVDFDPEETWRTRLRAANPTRPLCELDAATVRLVCLQPGE